MATWERRAHCRFTNTVNFTNVVTMTGHNPRVTLIAGMDDDTTITSLKSGYTYHIGTITGAKGATDDANVITLKLPTPNAAGERIRVYWTNAAVINKIVGVTVTNPATQTIKYWAYAQQVFIEADTTEVGTNGTEDTMVKFAVNSTILGDIWDFTAMSTTVWRMDINDATNIVEAADVLVDPGNAAGYID
jgi:uncharacterized Zn finger protein